MQDRPFVIRLIEDGGGESPGVVSFSEHYVTPAEEVGQVDRTCASFRRQRRRGQRRL